MICRDNARTQKIVNRTCMIATHRTTPATEPASKPFAASMGSEEMSSQVHLPAFCVVEFIVMQPFSAVAVLAVLRESVQGFLIGNTPIMGKKSCAPCQREQVDMSNSLEARSVPLWMNERLDSPNRIFLEISDGLMF